MNALSLSTYFIKVAKRRVQLRGDRLGLSRYRVCAIARRGRSHTIIRPDENPTEGGRQGVPIQVPSGIFSSIKR